MIDRTNQVLGNYRLLRLLGQGGQSSVYLGQHIRLQQKQAAVKILHAHLSKEAIKDFQREAEFITTLRHPHIVTVFDFDVQQDTPFLVMEHYSDGTLRKRHPRGERVPLATVITYVKQIASALQYAHDHRLVHRDIKPANMLIGEQGDIVLSDFGIAVVVHDTSSLGTQPFAGTVPYMAPEQIKQYPRRESDQYALAVVVYEWLTGKLPFNGTAEEIAIKHMTVEPLPLRHYLPDLAPGVEHVVLKALAKEPKERFPSVQEFALALEQAAQGKQDSSPLETPTHLLTMPAAVPLTKASEAGDQLSAASKEKDDPTQLLDDQAIFTPSLAEHGELVSEERGGSISGENTASVPFRTTAPAIWQKWQELTSRLPSCWFALLGIVLLSVYFSIATNGTFFSSLNLSNLLAGSAIYGIISVGLTLTIIVGEFDLSAGSFACFAGVAFALFVQRYGWPFPLAIIATLLVGILVGGLAGLIRSLFKIPVIITTLLYYFVFEYLSVALPGGMQIILNGVPGLASSILGLITLGIFLLAYIFTRHTQFGRGLVLVGTASIPLERADARLSKIIVMAISGMLAAVAGVVFTLWLSVAVPMQGTDWMLSAVAVLGISGNNLKGGQGRVLNTLVGVLFMAVLYSGLSLLGNNTLFPLVRDILIMFVLLRVLVQLWRSRESIKIRQ